jgi:hypothetical protein
MNEWTPIGESKPVIGYIHEGVYGFERLQVRLIDGREVDAEYSFHHGKNFWMITVDPNSWNECGTYLWDEDMTVEEFPDRLAVVSWRK